MPAKRILHYGIQRSGTNFFKEIIQRYFDVEVINKELDRAHPAHKHFRLYDNKALIGRPKYMNSLVFQCFDDFEEKLTSEWKADSYIVLSKDPYSWNISYTNWGKKQKWTSQSHAYITEYNEYHKKWLQFAGESNKVAMVRYVDLLTDADNTLDLLKEQFNFEDKVTNKFGKVKKVPRSTRFTKKRLEYYSNEEYMKSYDPEELKRLNDSIDHEVIKKLGYKSYF